MMKKIFLVLIIALAFILRFWRLDSYPALNADEAAIGYNVYSLLETGKDEHGNSWPIHFQSFNDYKPGLYFYIVLPFVKFLGLNAWSVRLPNALLGVGSVYILYLLIKELKIVNSMKTGNWKLEILAAAMLTISPWHIHFSRGGWEVNTATFFILAALLCFVYGLKKPRFYFLASVLFVLSLYTYHSARIVAPILGLGLLLIYKKEIFIKPNYKLLIINFLFLIISLFPLARDLITSNALSRAAGVGLSADIGPINRINEQRGEHENLNSINVKLVHNKFVNYSLKFLNNYSSHFSGEFLFMTGDSIERNKVPETGVMYLIDILFLAFGAVILFRHGDSKGVQLIILWLVIAPIASALTFQSPNALRSQNMVIPLTIISAIGFHYLLSLKMHKAYSILFIAILAWCFTRYLHMYYGFMSKEFHFSSQYGLKELIEYTSENESKYKNIVVTDEYDQPYILFLFYLKYPPVKFQNEHSLTSRDSFGFSTVREFGKYKFESIAEWVDLRTAYPNSLLVGTSKSIPAEANVIKKIIGPNDYEYFAVVAN